MTAAALERIRARWLAAPRAAFRVQLGDELLEISREQMQMLKTTGGLTTPAATPAPWDGATPLLGFTYARGQDVGAATVRTEFFEIGSIVSAFIDD